LLTNEVQSALSVVFLNFRWIAGHKMVTSRSCKDVTAASTISARTESAQTRKFISASYMSTKLFDHSGSVTAASN